MRKGTISRPKRKLSLRRRSIVRVITYTQRKFESSRPYSFGDRAKTIAGSRVPKVRENAIFTCVRTTFNVSVYVSVLPAVGNGRVFTCKGACSLVESLFAARYS